MRRRWGRIDGNWVYSLCQQGKKCAALTFPALLHLYKFERLPGTRWWQTTRKDGAWFFCAVCVMRLHAVAKLMEAGELSLQNQGLIFLCFKAASAVFELLSWELVSVLLETLALPVPSRYLTSRYLTLLPCWSADGSDVLSWQTSIPPRQECRW